MADKAAPDWERIESDYRAGILSLREIAGQHGISHVAINKRAKKGRWERDLRAKIQARADALVTKQAVTAAVTAARLGADKTDIEIGAQALANIKIGHQVTAGRTLDVGIKLLGELEAVGDPDLLPRMVEAIRNGDQEALEKSAMEALRKAVSLPSRMSTYKQGVEALKVAIQMQRQSWGIVDGTDGGSGGAYEDFLRTLG